MHESPGHDATYTVTVYFSVHELQLSIVTYDSGAGRAEAFGWLLPPGGGGERGATGTGSQCKEELVHPS